MSHSIDTFDVQFARSCYPYFQKNSENPIAFFNNAGGTFACKQVIDELTDFYISCKVQPYGNDRLAFEAGEKMDTGRRTIADMLGVSPDTITIGPSTTQNFNTLSIACRSFLKAGDEIIVSRQDHESNIGGWERTAKHTNAALKFWEIQADTGELIIEDLEKILSPKTRIVCMTHSSNIVGRTNPVEAVAKILAPKNIRLVIDGVSFAPHRFPNLKNLSCDAYCFSTYKTFATHLGIMYVSPKFADELEPQCHFFNTNKSGGRFDSAGPDHASIAALSGLGGYFTDLYRHHFGDAEKPLHEIVKAVSEKTLTYENTLLDKLMNGLAGLPFKILGNTQREGMKANISLVPLKQTPQFYTKKLAEKNIGAAYGHFYAYRLLEALGIKPESGVLRISLAHYNAADEIQKLLKVLKETG